MLTTTPSGFGGKRYYVRDLGLSPSEDSTAQHEGPSDRIESRTPTDSPVKRSSPICHVIQGLDLATERCDVCLGGLDLIWQRLIFGSSLPDEAARSPVQQL